LNAGVFSTGGGELGSSLLCSRRDYRKDKPWGGQHIPRQSRKRKLLIAGDVKGKSGRESRPGGASLDSDPQLSLGKISEKEPTDHPAPTGAGHRAKAKGQGAENQTFLGGPASGHMNYFHGLGELPAMHQANRSSVGGECVKSLFSTDDVL